jgi:hypothetical protein
MQTLDVEGPYEVPYTPNEHGAKNVAASHGRDFFAERSELADRRGCYLFAIRNRGMRAVYVGKATRGFGQEAFALDKLVKLNKALHRWPHGTPVVLFVVTPPRVHSTKLITDVEEYMIRNAKRMFPELLNKHHAGPDDWQIAGVTSSGPGRRSEAQTQLTRLLGLEGA